MANSNNLNLVTYNAAVSQLELEYYIPVASILGNPVGSIYAFLGQEDPWPTQNGVETPIQPTEDTYYFKKVFKNMFALKNLNSSNLSPVIQRINWSPNTVYTAYSDTLDLQAKDENGFLIYQYYVKNRYDQVFKCLWNNNGGPSTYEPYFEPGSYGTNNIYQNEDLYKWKYMYTIDTGSKKTFMDSSWMPVPIGANTPQPYLTTAGWGSVDVINVTNGGQGYDAVNTFITVTVTGDGVGANGSITPAQVVNGSIIDVVVPQGQAGHNYTYANVTISAYTSSNQRYLAPITTQATAIAPTSPVGGHAYDVISELGCNHIMLSVDFNGTENGVLPTDGVTYRQVGLLFNPQTYGASGPQLANGAIYNVATQVLCAGGVGSFAADEVVNQYDTSIPPNLLFSGTVLSFNTSTNLLQLINTNGNFVLGQAITGATSGCSRTVLTITEPSVIPFSGYLAYIENRQGVQRSDDGIEQFHFVLGY